MTKKRSPQALLLQAIRESRGLSRKQVADKAKLSQSQVKAMELDLRRITYETAKILAKVLKTGWHQLHQPKPKAA